MDEASPEMQAWAFRAEWIEKAAWALVEGEDDLEDLIVELRKALES